MSKIKTILNSDDLPKKKALFLFSEVNTNEEILAKFNIWSRYFFKKYFKSKDAPFHKDIDLNNLKIYRGEIKSFTDIAFRGGAKSVRTKLFVAFCIANDEDHRRRYFKVLAKDLGNAKQAVTDIYNMFVQPRVIEMYPEIFAKTTAKREETMGSFTTSTGVKLIADTVGTEQRGQVQEDARPDFVWFEDFETRKTLRSAVETKSIWDNMEEARTGLSKDGGCVYTCNYISEAGNVHKLILKEDEQNIVLITPIMDDNGKPNWDFYTVEEIEQMRKTDEDFWGERMCKPSASKDVLFNRESVEKQIPKKPIRETAGFLIYKEYDPSHRTASGHDVAGGVGLDSSTSVFIDFDTIPAQVCAVFDSNDIKPEAFGYEIKRETDIFGGCLSAVENNKFDTAIQVAKQEGVLLYTTEGKATKVSTEKPRNYGWNTNQLTKPRMLLAFSKAVEDGLIELNDEGLINECKSYTRNDLIDNVPDPRLTTRHFDKLMAACIAWQMKDHAYQNDIIVKTRY